MELLIKRANLNWFRAMLADEPDTEKREVLERKLAEAEREFEASMHDDIIAHA